MTHDEADHGLTAWQIVNGARDLYFTVGYGREPLYDYATALVMVGTGPTILAARLASVYFSLIMIAAVYAWTRRAFGAPVALLAAAGLAVGFWPLMAARQALRSIALPALFSLAILFFWQGCKGAGERGRKGPGEQVASGRGQVASRASNSPAPLHPRTPAPLRHRALFIIAGTLLGLTFYTYIPARMMWLAFPALTLYLILGGGWATRPIAGSQTDTGGLPTRPYKRRLLAGLGLTLLVAALVAAPLFLYLANNPGLEVRIDELSAPLRAAAGGDFAPLWANARGALRLFTIEGDGTWRYNIPGKPWLGPVMGVLFYAGLLVAGWLVFPRNRVWRTGVRSEKLGFYSQAAAPGAFLALIWLALGFAPVLVTGLGLSMTQAIGALPALYVFPALALVSGYRALVNLTADRRPLTTDHQPANAPRSPAPLLPRSPAPLRSAVGGLLAVVLFAALAALTSRDYFGRWANAPEVRVQYETTMVTALRYLDEHGDGAAAVSTIAPGRYHTPAVALLTLHNPAVRPRWFDGRQSLLLPDESDATLVVPGFTPIPAALQPYLAGAELVEELSLRPDDLDRPVRVYKLDGPAAIDAALETTADGRPLTAWFGEHIEFLGYSLAEKVARPGETLALVTAWRLLAPLPGASLFAHVAGPAEPLAVADSLGAPGESWLAGDVLLQLHEIAVPPGAPAGTYPLVVGVYTQDDGRRLTTDGGADTVTLTELTVRDE
jgi:hypothetical protein